MAPTDLQAMPDDQLTRCRAGVIDGDCQSAVSAAHSGTATNPAQINTAATRITFNAAITRPTRLGCSWCFPDGLLQRATLGLFYVGT